MTIVDGKKIASEILESCKRKISILHDNGKTPYCLKSGIGSKVKDIDNNSYIDFMNGLGCNLLGYNVPFINKAINKEIKNGVLLPISNELEVEVAK